MWGLLILVGACLIAAWYARLLPSVIRFADDSALPAAHEDLAHRRPVWTALSELYLDTELDDADHARIASQLSASPYSLAQLDRILFAELHGLLIVNLFSVAGAWDGFDLEPICEALVAASRRRRRPPANRRLCVGAWMVRDHWEAIRARVERERTAEPAAARPPP